MSSDMTTIIRINHEQHDAPYMSSDMTTIIRINHEQHDEYLIGRNCLQIPEPLFHSLSIGSSSCSHVLMY